MSIASAASSSAIGRPGSLSAAFARPSASDRALQIKSHARTNGLSLLTERGSGELHCRGPGREKIYRRLTIPGEGARCKICSGIILTFPVITRAIEEQ